MKVLRSIGLLFLLSNSIYTALGQSKALEIGDYVPDLEFNNLINTDKPSIKLSDFRGKLIILDFWATWCVPCVKSLPKLDSLQRKYKSEIVILPITTDKEETIIKFLKQHPEHRSSLPYVFDTRLKDYFPYRIIPHEVWIDGNGKLINITGSEEVNDENIQKILALDEVQIKQKNDIVDRDENKPFIAGFFGSYQLAPDDVQYSSIITKGFEGLPGMQVLEPKHIEGYVYARSTNNYVYKLYQSALVDFVLPSRNTKESTAKEFYTKKEFYLRMNSRVVWEAGDSTYYYGPENKALMDKKPYKEKVFNFELLLPETDNETFRSMMLQDLNRYFGLKYGIEGGRELRKVWCYALTVVGKDSLFQSNGGNRSLVLRKGVKSFKAVNMPIDDIMFYYLSFHLPYDFPTPIINETNYSGMVDFDLGEIDPSDFNAVNSALKNFGLEFKLVEREIEMIVIKDYKESAR